MRCEVCIERRIADAFYLWHPYLDKARSRASDWTPICDFCIRDFRKTLFKNATIIKQREDT